MRRLRQMFREMSLHYKLIVAFASFLVVPFLIIGGALSWLYVDSNRDMVLEAAVKNNQQVVNNVDTAFKPLLRLSMYPVQDETIFRIMKKDYETVAYPKYERAQDFDTVNNIIRNSMMLYTDIIDSALIYQIRNHMIIGRSNMEFMDHDYLEKEFFQEPYVQEILNERGRTVTIGVHPDKLTTFHHDPVVSLGRAIIDPYTKDSLGFILFNIGLNKLEQLWNPSIFTENTRFFLLDDNNDIIYSQEPDEIGKRMESVLENDWEELANYEQEVVVNESIYRIASTSEVTGWHVVTIIPKHELFGFLYTILEIIIIFLLVFLVLSIIASAYIARSIMKPLAELEEKMKQVSEGNMNVSIDIKEGEVGSISKTIDHMLAEIRQLINRIYEEETEKKQMEMLALQSQIRPHFMYNTINVIKWMAKMQGAAGIEEALNAFSSVIKFTAKTEKDHVTIKEEVAFVKNYTSILELRYFNKFDVEFDVDQKVLEYKTLKFLLQPVLENAIFHGFNEIDYKGRLTIRIEETSKGVRMTVADNGRGMTEHDIRNMTTKNKVDKLNSIGISNIKKRIELNYGEPYGVSIASDPTTGTTVTILIPVIKGDGNEDSNR